MAGINVPQYDLFKIGTKELKYNKWDLTISKDDAYKTGKIVSLFQSEMFRLIGKILNKPMRNIDFSDYVLMVVVDTMGDFAKVMRKDGIKINGKTFKRFVGTTGGLKNCTLVFVNVEILDELNNRCQCDMESFPIVPAKLEAYKALTCSASQRICEPHGILVVSDALVKIHADCINVDDSGDAEEPDVYMAYDEELENNASDGFNLCTIDYMQRVSESLGIDYVTDGVCLRNAWLKGMMFAFPIVEFFDKYANGNYMVQDVWGNMIDIRKVDLILTESSLKCWKGYKSVNEYIKAYRQNGYGFAVTKIMPKELDDVRETNYQYLQSYKFSDADIEELCAPTIKYLKNALCGDYESTIKFLGINENSEKATWKEALFKSEFMLHDPFIIDATNRLISKAIDRAKIGRLRVHGNYQIISGDPVTLMQSIVGMDMTGLLKAGEVFSRYWVDRDVDEIVIFRSPMTSHNNIRKRKVVMNEDIAEWYKYMRTILIFNSFDTMCAAMNGADFDGDMAFSTNNPVLMRCYREEPAIFCIQRNVPKVIPTEKDIIETNKNGMGNKVGSVTNKVTAMMETQANFAPDSREYAELQKRIMCGQLYQQNEIDKIKGIVAKPMPKYWYDLETAKGKDAFQVSICTHKPPYFMTYIYDDYMREYKKFIKETSANARKQFNKTLEELLADPKTEAEKYFIEGYYRFLPFGLNDCSMNRICRYVEQQFEGYTKALKHHGDFDYNKLKTGHRIIHKHVDEIKNHIVDFSKMIAKYSSENDKLTGTYDKAQFESLKNYYINKLKEVCPNDEERLDIMIDFCYKTNYHSTCWMLIGDQIINRLENLDVKE